MRARGTGQVEVPHRRKSQYCWVVATEGRLDETGWCCSRHRGHRFLLSFRPDNPCHSNSLEHSSHGLSVRTVWPDRSLNCGCHLTEKLDGEMGEATLRIESGRHSGKTAGILAMAHSGRTRAELGRVGQPTWPRRPRLRAHFLWPMVSRNLHSRVDELIACGFIREGTQGWNRPM